MRDTATVTRSPALFLAFTLSLTTEALNTSSGSSSHSPVVGRLGRTGDPQGRYSRGPLCQHLVLIKRCQFEFAALRRHKDDIELLSYYMYCSRLDETSGSDDSSKDARRRLVSSDHIQPLSMIVEKDNYEY